MIITQTPFRMSFFGGGTDYPEFYMEHGGCVLSTTFDKYCYVMVRHLPPFFDYSNQVTYGIIERTNSADEIVHPAVREAMKWLKMYDLRIVYEADLPARSGLGSSSSFAVGLLSAFYSIKGKYVDKKKLADDAIYLERTLCNENGGIQDQIAVAYGGFNRIDFKAGGYSVSPVIMPEGRKKKLNSRLMLFFTGFSRLSSTIAEKQKEATNKKVHELLEMKVLVDEAEKVLASASDNLDEFGKLLDYSWKVKRSLTDDIATDFIDEIYNRAVGAGALGGKLLGAGGGGFMVFYVEPDRQASVKNALSDLIYVPFEFENLGSKVMYYTAEPYKKVKNRKGEH